MVATPPTTDAGKKKSSREKIFTEKAEILSIAYRTILHRIRIVAAVPKTCAAFDYGEGIPLCRDDVRN